MSESSKSSSAAAPRPLAALGMLIGRSLFPLMMVIILGGTLLWGPWVTLVLALAWFITISFIG
jgi:hypothetical protein